ncbi:hypothetical protein BJX66DRAFT_331215 [Aspergillus keveii]|uniref:Short-chain dehydrogenase/reductase n=1 Tax=Aspergillus keveii TaxID=714993 RepID=A0ABR4GRB6_9EURO
MSTSAPKRSILITGCSHGGAGNALALEFAARGLRVFATARSLKSIANLAESGIETLALDVTDRESIAAVKTEISKRTGGTLDMLYNNAGTMYEAPAIEADRTRIHEMFDTNVFGLFDMVTAFTPLLLAAVHTSTSKSTKQQQQPTIINIASIVSRIPLPFAAAYNASKAGVSAYSDTLRLELAPLGIRVVTVFMGEVATKLRSADKINFGAESLYADVGGKLKERIEHGARVSVAPEFFAKEVVDKVLVQRGDGVSYIWKGTNAFLVWFLNAVGPRKVFDSIMKGFVGFDDKGLVKLIYERGRQAVAAEKVDGHGQ